MDGDAEGNPKGLYHDASRPHYLGDRERGATVNAMRAVGRFVSVALRTAGLILAGCAVEEPIQEAGKGTGSETTNHIAGVVWESEGPAAARTLVSLVPAGFDPLRDTLPPGRIALTDAEGRFRFDDPGAGSYSIEALSLRAPLRGRRGDIAYPGGHQNLSNLVIEAPGCLRVNLPADLHSAGGHVLIPGSSFRAVVGESREVLFRSLPPMRIASLVYARDAASPRVILAENLVVRSGDTTELEVPATHEAQFLFDGSAAGAALEEDVVDFPLLVRLDSANFDFSLTSTYPGLAFARPDGTPLRFQVERWSASSRKAEIWVRMDTLRAGADSQALVMRWRTPDPADQFKKLNVFDTASGYVGVWHLGDATTARVDATPIGRWAETVNYDGDETVEGMVARADRLDRSDDFLDLGVVDVEKTITLSAWIKPERINANWAAIIYKPSDEGSASRVGYSLEHKWSSWTSNFGLGGQGRSMDLLHTPAGKSAWILLHGTYDGRKSVLYVNGDKVLEESGTFTSPLCRNGYHTLAGAYVPNDPERNFGGIIDELRIEKVARSPAWVRLSYESQRSDRSVLRRTR